MKKKLFIIIPLIILIIISLIFILKKDKSEKFYLEDKYYNSKEVVQIDKAKYEDLVKNKESFVVFVYQPACYVSEGLERVVNEFQNKNNISYYKIAFSEIKTSEKAEFLKYYPSFIIFNKGKQVAFLDSSAKEHVPYYEDINEFTKWFYEKVLKK